MTGNLSRHSFGEEWRLMMIRENSCQFTNGARLTLVGFMIVAVSVAFAGTSGTWSTTGSLNVPRFEHTATLLSNGEVLVAGGANRTTGYLSSAELYNPATGKWSLTGSMTAARDGHQAVLLPNGQVLVAGGINASVSMCGTLASAELFNPATGAWTSTGNMTSGRFDFIMTVLANGEVLAAGGTNCGGGGLTSAELYNPATQTWTATGSMTTGDESAGAVLLQNGQVFALGSRNIYNPTTGTWSATNTPPIVANAPVALLPTGNLWVAGQSIQGDLIFNVSTAQWSVFAPPPCTSNSQSCQAAGALLKTGKILVAGGVTFVNAQPYPKEETNGFATLLDTSSLTWTQTGSLSTSRISETMTILPNGQALVAGGQTFSKKAGTLVPINSAELFTP